MILQIIVSYSSILSFILNSFKAKLRDERLWVDWRWLDPTSQNQNVLRTPSEASNVPLVGVSSTVWTEARTGSNGLDVKPLWALLVFDQILATDSVGVFDSIWAQTLGEPALGPPVVLLLLVLISSANGPRGASVISDQGF